MLSVCPGGSPVLSGSSIGDPAASSVPRGRLWQTSCRSRAHKTARESLSAPSAGISIVPKDFDLSNCNPVCHYSRKVALKKTEILQPKNQFPKGSLLPGLAAGGWTVPHSRERPQVQGWARMVSCWAFCPFSAASSTQPLSIVSHRRRFDLQNPSRTERNVEMFGAIERALIQVPYAETTGRWDEEVSVQIHFNLIFLLTQTLCVCRTTACHILWCIWTTCWIMKWPANLPPSLWNTRSDAATLRMTT